MGKDLKGKELGEGLSQLPDKRYIGRFSSKNGKRIQKTFKSLKECKKWLADSVCDDDCYYQDMSNITIKQWVDIWIEYKKSSVKLRTVENYEKLYEVHIKKHLENMQIKNIKAIHCQKVLNEMIDAGYKKNTVNSVRIAMSDMLQCAVLNDIIPYNPCHSRISIKRAIETTKRKAITIEEQKKLLNGSKNSTYFVQYAFILQTGLRVGELIGLRWSDIDFENRKLTICRQMYDDKEGWHIETPKSEKSNRVITLNDESIRLLLIQKEKNAKLKTLNIECAESVFVSKKGELINNNKYNMQLYRYRKRLGITNSLSMHILRHTFATRCIEAGMNPKTLQYILGHSDISTTMNLYVDVMSDYEKEEVLNIQDKLKIV